MSKQAFTRILSLDLDGTILDTNKNYPPELNEVFKMLTLNGVGILINSGRPWQSTRLFFPDDIYAQFWIAGLNGSILMNASAEVVKSETLSPTIIRPIIEQICYDQVACILFSTDFIACNAITDKVQTYAASLRIPFDLQPDIATSLDIAPWHAIALRFPLEQAETVTHQAAQLCDHNTKQYLSLPTMLDIAPINAGKELAIQTMATYFNLDTDSCYAIGDGPNDIPMLQSVKYGAVVANSTLDNNALNLIKSQESYSFGVIELIRKWNLI